MKKILAVLLAAAIVFSLSVSAFAAKKITISVPDPTTSYIYAAAEEFAKRATEYSEGTLEFNVSANGSLYGGDTAEELSSLVQVHFRC